MPIPNDTDRVRVVAELIHDAIMDDLHHHAELAGELETATMPTSDQVQFAFSDERVVTVRVEIGPKP